MRSTRLVLSVLALITVMTVPIGANRYRPFIGSWSGVTISADPTNFPVVAVVSEGTGWLTPLGHYSMISPHTSHVETGETIGAQIFTAANGDKVTAHCEGFPEMQTNGSVVGPLDCDITGGTGRYRGARGSYVFFLVAKPRTDGGIGYETDALIIGKISY
jgi:hypothetical protein